MRRSRVLVCVAIAALSSASSVGAQAPIPQLPTGTPMPGVQPPAQSVPADAVATIEGRVTASDTGSPLRGAHIQLYGSGPNARVNRSARADRDGRYRFDRMTPGPYTILASRPGFVTMRAGQKSPRERAILWLLSPAETERVDFALPRGGVIFGRLTDDTGEPLAGIQLIPLRVLHSPNGERLQPDNSLPFSNHSDDRGDFRVAGLAPGTYVLAAQHQSDEDGENLVTTFYPGTTNAKQARRIRVGMSEQVGASFAMQSGRLVRVSGYVQSSNGHPLPNARIMLRTETTVGIRVLRVEDASGQFEISGVAPGEYTLDVSSASTGGMPDFFKQTEFTSVKLSVGTEDLTGLVITTGAGTTVTGRVTYESSTGRSPDAAKVQVYAAIQDGPFGMRPPSADRNNGLLAEDGSFTITGGYGKMLFRVGRPGWQLKSVILDGVDITDVPYDASRGNISGLEVVLTDERQEVIGKVADAFGKPATRYVVIVFPGELGEGAVPGRFIRVATPQQDGIFRLTNLPPASYLAAAFEAIDQDAEFDPAFRERARSRATSFHLSPGQTRELELALIE